MLSILSFIMESCHVSACGFDFEELCGGMRNLQRQPARAFVGNLSYITRQKGGPKKVLFGREGAQIRA